MIGGGGALTMEVMVENEAGEFSIHGNEREVVDEVTDEVELRF